MATPTPGKHASMAPTPPVSTPFSGSQSHLAAFSPHGPKSVSPQQFKKSPANSNTLYGHPSNSSFGAINFDSPTTAAALGSMPHLGDLTLDGSGAVGLGGIALHGSGRTDEDEQKRKLEQVIHILKTENGRVSEEGIERLARRIGLECLWETQMGSGGSTRTLIIAGTGLSLDIDFANNSVEKVALSFPESPEIVTKHAFSGGQILLSDLKLQPHETPLTKMLDKFAINLERLAALDKLSVMPTLNCHAAVAGIFESLKRLHEWEISRMREEEHLSDKAEIETLALRSRSGRPLMNVRGTVGCRLDYWQDRPWARNGYQVHSGEATTWSLIMECANSSTLVYPPIRVSANWISANVEKINPTADDLLLATAGPVLDWQDPENILLPAADIPKGENNLEDIVQDHATASKFPDVVFVVRFSPPLIVPYSTAVQIYNSTGATLDSYQLSTYDGLLFPTQSSEKGEADGSHRRIRRLIRTTTFDKDGTPTKNLQRRTLTAHKLEYGREITELPFSHPRQLVDMLPILRQYAHLSSFLEKSFRLDTDENPVSKTSGDDEPGTVIDEFTSFMAEVSSPGGQVLTHNDLPIDLSLYTQPLPRMRLTFPFRGRTGDISFEIRINGAFHVISENILDSDESQDGDKGKSRAISRDDLARMLDLTDDIGVFVEYIRKRL